MIIEQSADRAPFVCQSQSLNLFVESPSRGKLTSMLFHSWKRKLVTGIYYLRSRPKSDPVQFVVNKVHVKGGGKGESAKICSRAKGLPKKKFRTRSPPPEGRFFDNCPDFLENSLKNLVGMPEAVFGNSFQVYIQQSVRERIVCKF